MQTLKPRTKNKQLLDACFLNPFFKGVFSKPSGNHIALPNFCLLS
jgi:hypothetical protein